MKDVKKSTEKPEPSDPAGPPKPVEKNDDIGLLTAVGVTATVFGTLFAMCGLTARPTCGATRSARLQWHERQTQIDEAWAEELVQRQRHHGQRTAASKNSP